MNVTIHDLVWDVNFTDIVDSDDDNLCGETYKSMTEITIYTYMSEELIHRTIRHEVVHAFIWSYGLENSFPMTEEQLCNFIETFGKEIERITEQIWNYYLQL